LVRNPETRNPDGTLSRQLKSRIVMKFHNPEMSKSRNFTIPTLQNTEIQNPEMKKKIIIPNSVIPNFIIMPELNYKKKILLIGRFLILNNE